MLTGSNLGRRGRFQKSRMCKLFQLDDSGFIPGKAGDADWMSGGYCGVWLVKCRQRSKTNKPNCKFCKKSTYDWI